MVSQQWFIVAQIDRTLRTVLYCGMVVFVEPGRVCLVGWFFRSTGPCLGFDNAAGRSLLTEMCFQLGSNAMGQQNMTDGLGLWVSAHFPVLIFSFCSLSFVPQLFSQWRDLTSQLLWFYFVL